MTATKTGLSWVVMAILFVGCSPRAVPQEETGDPVEEVTFESVTYEQWQAVVAGSDDGILVVDMWATWCVPCVERFPKMVEMYHHYSPQGVAFASMSLDDRGDAGALERAFEFLQEQRAVFPNYRMDEEVLEGFEKLDLLTIPAVYVYDQGSLRHRFVSDHPDRQFTEADIQRTIEDLLALRDSSEESS